MASTYILCIVTLLVILFNPIHSQKTKIVVTKHGKIEGIQVDVPYFQSYVNQFRRIPYAKPPIGDLRFFKPQPIEPWNTTLNATAFGPSCMQTILNPNSPLLPNSEVSEDCLFLNIYQPPNITAQSNKSVMVFIHGGSYIFGQGMLYDGSSLAIYGDVILVTINYRLGVFGFLSTGNEHCPGNFGLWDQKLAIQWVKDNIASFGGNPKMITIFGESAGGFSVSLHSIVPHNNGLFQRAMAHSGSSNSFFALSDAAKIAGLGIGVFADCREIVNSAAFIKCMRSKPANDILTAMYKAANVTFDLSLRFELPLAPVVDGDFILEEPKKTLSDESAPGYKFFRSLDFVGGDVNSEGSLIFQLPLVNYQKRLGFNFTEGIPYRVLCNDAIESVIKDYFSHNATLKQRACELYKSVNSKLDDQSRNAIDWYSDLFFFTPAVLTLNAHASGNKIASTHQFLLRKENRYGFGYPYPRWFTGAGHGAELPYLFGVQLDPTTSKEDNYIAHQALSYWSNFAKTGDPNHPMKVDIAWTPYNTEERSFINLDYPITQDKAMFKERIDFWTAVFPHA